MKKTEDSGIPEFQSMEEEREYWEARGPLAEGHKGKLNRPRHGQRRSSFLAVRLTGDELTRLRDVAAKQGMGPSTFARHVLAEAVEQRGTRNFSISPWKIGWLSYKKGHRDIVLSRLLTGERAGHRDENVLYYIS